MPPPRSGTATTTVTCICVMDQINPALPAEYERRLTLMGARPVSAAVLSECTAATGCTPSISSTVLKLKGKRTWTESASNCSSAERSSSSKDKSSAAPDLDGSTSSSTNNGSNLSPAAVSPSVWGFETPSTTTTSKTSRKHEPTAAKKTYDSPTLSPGDSNNPTEQSSSDYSDDDTTEQHPLGCQYERVFEFLVNEIPRGQPYMDCVCAALEHCGCPTCRDALREFAH